MRNLLGDKFSFLTSCEHYFSTECLTEMVTSKINEGQVSQLRCPNADCQKGLNDLDVKNLDLDREMMEKYEQYSVQNAIAAMDDMCWCPIPTCGSIAYVEKEENAGKC